jgi:hypothetical protein
MSWANIAGCALLFAVVLYLVALFRIAFHPKKSVCSPEMKCTLPAILSITSLDCEFATIWQTQVPTLKLLRLSGDRGLSLASLVPLFRGLARKYPELCDGAEFEDWMSALEHAEVIVRNGSMIRIADKGLFVIELFESGSMQERHETEIYQLHHSG